MRENAIVTTFFVFSETTENKHNELQSLNVKKEGGGQTVSKEFHQTALWMNLEESGRQNTHSNNRNDDYSDKDENNQIIDPPTWL